MFRFILIRFKNIYFIGLLLSTTIMPTVFMHNSSYFNTQWSVITQDVDIKSLTYNKRSLKDLLLSSVSVRGERFFNICSSCHTVNNNGPHKIGPNLWNVLLRPIACLTNYAYSYAIKSKSKFNWSFNRLNKFLENPSNYIRGTYMTFSGLKEPSERVDVMSYLNSYSFRPLNFNYFKFNI